MNRKHPQVDTTFQSSPQLTVILDRFKRAWETGRPPDITAFVDDVVDPQQRCKLLVEIVAVDLEYRWRRIASSGEDSAPGDHQFLAGASRAALFARSSMVWLILRSGLAAAARSKASAARSGWLSSMRTRPRS